MGMCAIVHFIYCFTIKSLSGSGIVEHSTNPHISNFITYVVKLDICGLVECTTSPAPDRDLVVLQ